MLRVFLLLLACTVLVQCGGVKLERLFNKGATEPVFIGFEPGNDTMAYIVEKGGTIKKFNLSTKTFESGNVLDISSVLKSGELHGLYSIAFHPNFSTNQTYFVNYTRDSDGKTIVSKYTMGSSTETIVLEITLPSNSDHPGGLLQFGSDGYLYISQGDGGTSANAQDLTVLPGKILRIDVDSGSPYAIPSDNPFVGTSNREEIFAYGFRNPWRMSFDKQTGALFVGDVGQSTWEEVNHVTSGKNYGWPTMEGSECSTEGCDKSGLETPIYEYGHPTGQATAVIGGYVYRGAIEKYQGRYIYADVNAGEIRAIDYDQTSSTFQKHEVLDAAGLPRVTSFGQNSQGELYVLTLSGLLFQIK